ncbi:MAG: biotin-dependent carboxyltransferase family protein [Pseudomonadota bacterium]
MSRNLIVHSIGPSVTVQDLGRAGYMAFGLSRGGAADRLALAEGAALLGQAAGSAALEMAGMGGTFEATEDLRIALTGAPMAASIDGAALTWNASHLLAAGERLTVGAAQTGVYGYLHVGGGLETPTHLGARCAHLVAGIGEPIQPGAKLPVGSDSGMRTGQKIDAEPRFAGGTARIVPSLQTAFFTADDIARFGSTLFRRDTRGNRMGVRLLPDGEGFQSTAGLSVLSEVIVPGDIQVTGDGTPYVLLAESQTTGGYPRIGSVIPADLPLLAQARPGTEIRFAFITLDEAVAIERREFERRQKLRQTLSPLIRDPHDIPDLLSYQLISGVTAGDDL